LVPLGKPNGDTWIGPQPMSAEKVRRGPSAGVVIRR